MVNNVDFCGLTPDPTGTRVTASAPEEVLLRLHRLPDAGVSWADFGIPCASHARITNILGHIDQGLGLGPPRNRPGANL